MGHMADIHVDYYISYVGPRIIMGRKRGWVGGGGELKLFPMSCCSFSSRDALTQFIITYTDGRAPIYIYTIYNRVAFDISNWTFFFFQEIRFYSFDVVYRPKK